MEFQLSDSVFVMIRGRLRQRTSVAERRYPTPEIRGRSREDPMPKVGGWLRVPGCDGTGTAKRSYPMSKVRGGG